jgi:hypothetical protein
VLLLLAVRVKRLRRQRESFPMMIEEYIVLDVVILWFWDGVFSKKGFCSLRGVLIRLG